MQCHTVCTYIPPGRVVKTVLHLSLKPHTIFEVNRTCIACRIPVNADADAVVSEIESSNADEELVIGSIVVYVPVLPGPNCVDGDDQFQSKGNAAPWSVRWQSEPAENPQLVSCAEVNHAPNFEDKWKTVLCS